MSSTFGLKDHMKLLMGNGANPNLPDKNNGLFPVIEAFEKGKLDLVNFFVEANDFEHKVHFNVQQIDKQFNKGKTIIHSFLTSFDPKSTENVQTFLGLWNKPNIYCDLMDIINAKDESREGKKLAPLFKAIEYKWPRECIDKLVENGARFNGNLAWFANLENNPKYPRLHSKISPEELEGILNRNCIIHYEFDEEGQHKALVDFSIFAPPPQGDFDPSALDPNAETEYLAALPNGFQDQFCEGYEDKQFVKFSGHIYKCRSCDLDCCKICRQICHKDHNAVEYAGITGKKDLVSSSNQKNLDLCFCKKANGCKVKPEEIIPIKTKNQHGGEMYDLWKLSQSESFKHLLQHRVIEEFLHLKWNSMENTFFSEFRLALTFVTTITWFIFTKFSGLSLRGSSGFGFQGNETTFCDEIMETKSSSIVYMIGYWIFCIMFICQLISIVTCNLQINKITNWQRLVFSILRDWFVIVIGIVILTVDYWSVNFFGLWIPLQILILMRTVLKIGKIFQGLDVFMSMKNWIQILNLIMIFLIIWLPNNSCDIKRQLAAFVLVFSWTDFAITLLKFQHPIIAIVNVHAFMLQEVFKSFLKFTFLYLPLILSFAFGFYIMLHNDYDEKDEFFDQANTGSPHFTQFFHFTRFSLYMIYITAVVKTMIMFVGEIEFGDLPIDRPSCYLFVILFIFVVVIILMNLLNGLAVDDIGKIREDAEWLALSSKINNLYLMEKSEIFSATFSFFFEKMLWRIPQCCTSFFSSSINSKNNFLLFESQLKFSKVVEYLDDKAIALSYCKE